MRSDASTEQQAMVRHLAGVGIAVLVLSTMAFFRVPLLPEIGRDLSMSAAQLGVITSMFGAGRLSVDLPAGRMLDRIAPTVLLAGSAALMVTGSLALAAAARPLAVYAAAFALGSSSAVTNATGMHAFSVSVPARRRGTALAVFSTALLGGQALGPLLGGGLASTSSWRVAMVVAGAVSLVLTLALVRSPLLGLRRRRTSTAVTAAPTASPAAATAKASASPAAAAAGDHGDTVVERTAARLALLGVAFAMFFSLGAMPQTLIPVIGATELDLGVASIGVALGLGGVCRLIGGFVGGTIADRVSRRSALLPGLALQALGVGLVAGGSAAWWLAGIAVMSLASWSISTAATMLADLAPRGGLGTRLGSFRFVGDIGLITGPLVAGQLFERAGRVPATAAVVALLLTAAVWCAISVPETRVRS